MGVRRGDKVGILRVRVRVVTVICKRWWVLWIYSVGWLFGCLCVSCCLVVFGVWLVFDAVCG